MYKTESTLGLVASILNVVVAALFLIGLLATFLFAGTAQWFIGGFKFGPQLSFPMFHMQNMMGWIAGLASIGAGCAFVLKAAAAVLGFIGVSQLNRDNKNGGVLLLVGAGLSLISGGFITMVLLLIGGVLALSKKPAIPQQG